MDSLNMRIEYYISTFSNLDPVTVKTIVKKYNNKNEDKLIEKLLELSKVSIQPCIDEQISKNILDDELKFTPTGCTILKSDAVKKKKKKKTCWFKRTTDNNLLFQKFD